MHVGGESDGWLGIEGVGGAKSEPPTFAPLGSAQVPAWELAKSYSGYPGKRALDIVLAATLLLVSTPILLSVALAVGMTSRGPVFYGHERVGRNGQRFRCLKFRTMCADAEARLERLLDSDPIARAEFEASYKLRSDPRVTRIGSILRRTSVDELPQLFNVVLGHMSLVGPRPVVEEELSRYAEFKAAYLSARPGLTGAWQVSGRSDTTYEERVAMDVTYLEQQSLLQDASILLRTVSVVARRIGAY